MTATAHIIGNGVSSTFYKPSPGLKLTCNLPPFPVEDAFGTCMVDFKMMKAITDGSVTVPGDWILGFRPKKWTEMHPQFYMKYAPQIKEFYLNLPKYITDYTALSCGHFAVHYAATKHMPDEINMYGFDSLFDFDLRSCTDFYLQSDRDHGNTTRLTNNWRAGWPGIFNEFINIKFNIYAFHDDIKFDVPKNVNIIVDKN